MHRTVRWAANALAVVVVGLVVSCGALVRDEPRPASGAGTSDELIVIYREAHLAKEPERFRKIDLTLSLLADWIPMDKEKRSSLLGLFELELEDARVVQMPLLDPDGQLAYVCQSPDGGIRADVLIPPELYGRLVLVGRRPDGVRVEVDPGFGVTRLKGRLYVEMLTLVAEDAARSVRFATQPRYRLIPHGTYREYTKWERAGKRTWREAMRKLDELEGKAKNGGKEPQARP